MATLSVEAVIVRNAGAEPAVEEALVADPGPGELRLRLLASGVCHTDLHALGGGMGDEFPYLLGHEGCGVVESVGAGVDPNRVGERVIICWRAPCGRCRFCRRGDLELCASVLAPGPRIHAADGVLLTPVLGAGTFITHTVVADGQAVTVADDIPPEVACLIGCGIATGVGAAVRTARVGAGDRVAVLGCGAVGLSVVQGARLAGASTIIAIDLNPAKLEWAKRLGATAVVEGGGDDVVSRVRELSGGHGVDHCFDVVGVPATLRTAIECCDDAGVATLVGVPPRDAELALPLSLLWNRRRGVRACWYGNCYGPRDFALLADWYRNGVLHLDEMVSRRIGLHEVGAAFAAMKGGGELRSVIRF